MKGTFSWLSRSLRRQNVSEASSVWASVVSASMVLTRDMSARCLLMVFSRSAKSFPSVLCLCVEQFSAKQ